jgi:hypothetical protein
MAEPAWRFYVISMSESEEKSFFKNKMSRGVLSRVCGTRHDKKNTGYRPASV